jgi:carboxypeptidase PM20D1
MKKIFILICGVIVLIITVVVLRTMLFKSKQLVLDIDKPVTVSDSSIINLQKAIQFKTISYDDASLIDSSQFLGFHDFLQSTYPLVFSKLTLEKVNELSLVLHWKGKDAGKDPLVLMAHQDVVPIEESSIHEWKADPFSGEIKDGVLYGRGAIDDKGSLIAILESAEMLLKDNFVPEVDIYFVFGHDEEVSGQKGAKAIVQLFKERGIKPRMVLDEGGIITTYKVPGLKKTAAVIGIAEKGYLTLDLTIKIAGGHSSMPEKKTAIEEMAKAVYLLNKTPFPAEIGEVVHLFMDYVGPEMPFVSKMAMANRWLFSPIIKNTYSKTPAANAVLRTTSVTTIFNAGIKENLVPGEARATINFRTQPGVSKENVIAHVKKVVGMDSLEINARANNTESTALANIDDPTFKYLQERISSYKKDIVVAPYLMLGATDGRFFSEITTQVFRFAPFTDPEGFHGVNERIPVQDFNDGIGFYYQFLKNYELD